MAQWRISLEFRNAVGAVPTSGRLYGWTENLYHFSNLTAAQILTLAQVYLPLRLGLVTTGWRVSRMRFSVFPNTRVAFSYSPSPASGRGTYPMPAPVTDEQPYDRLLNSAVCLSGKGATPRIGGIGSDVVDPGGIYLAPGAFTANYAFWKDALLGGFAIRRRTLAGGGSIAGVQTTTIGAYVATPVTPLVTVNNIGLGLSPGDPVRISGVIGIAGLNGTWVVDRWLEALGLTYVWLRQKRGVQVVGTYVGGGRLVTYTYALDRITDIAPSRGVSRRTGGTSDRPRGRRSRRVS